MRRSPSSFWVLSIIALLACSNERAAPPPLEEAAPPAGPVAVNDPPPIAPAPSPPPQPSTATSEGRDPFEPAAVTTLATLVPPKSRDVRPRKSKRFMLDELKLVGIVSNADMPRAMLVDPRGKGWVVTRGELVGRPETMRDREGDHSVSWRVDRIRESDVILVREDIAHSTVVPSSTRVLALRHDERPIADDAEADD